MSLSSELINRINKIKISNSLITVKGIAHKLNITEEKVTELLKRIKK